MLELITAKTDARPAERSGATLDDLARAGAQRMIEAALQVEVAEYVARYPGDRDAARPCPGRAQWDGAAAPGDRWGRAGDPSPRPRVNDRRVVDGQRQKFTSAILPPYVRRSPKVASVLPLLYLHGLSTGDFREALPALLGPKAAGLSPSAITRLTKAWTAEYAAFRRRDLADRDYVYLWADGVHFTIRLEDERLCTLVLIGVRPDGTKEVVALEDGYRESTESWRTVLRDLKRRGMRAPALAVGDGALGFWAAVREVWPETAEQRCWVHRIANVLDKLPKRLQPRAKRALHEMMYAETRAAAEREIARFVSEYGAKYPKAVASLTIDQARLLSVLRLPRRALEAPADDEPDRVDVRDGPAARARDQGRGLPDGRARDGVQAARSRRKATGGASTPRNSCRWSGPGSASRMGSESNATPQKREKAVA